MAMLEIAYHLILVLFDYYSGNVACYFIAYYRLCRLILLFAKEGISFIISWLLLGDLYDLI